MRIDCKMKIAAALTLLTLVTGLTAGAQVATPFYMNVWQATGQKQNRAVTITPLDGIQGFYGTNFTATPVITVTPVVGEVRTNLSVGNYRITIQGFPSAMTIFWPADPSITNAADPRVVRTGVTEMFISGGLKGGANVSLSTNGTEVTINADVSHAEVQAATNGVSTALAARVTAATNDLRATMAQTGITNNGDGLGNAGSVTLGGTLTVQGASLTVHGQVVDDGQGDSSISGTLSGAFSGNAHGSFSGTLAGDASGATNLNAGAMASGTIPVARLPALGAAYPNAITNNSTTPYTNLAGVASSFFGPGNGLTTTNGYTFTNATAQYYCARVNDTNIASMAAMDQFFGGIASLGLAGNLMDAAFFDRAANNGPSLLTLSNSVVTVGPGVLRMNGGMWLSNHIAATCTNMAYVTNVAGADNHTLIVWFSQSITGPSPTAGGIEIYSLGDTSLGLYASLGGDLGGSWPRWYDGSMHSGARDLGVFNDNRLRCAAQTGGTSMDFWLFADNQNLSPLHDGVAGSYNTAWGKPTVLRFGTVWTSTTNCANVIYRGFAYFNTIISSNVNYSIDGFVPRIGLVIEGDSKSIAAPNAAESYGQMFQESPSLWGLVSEITNSGVGGSTLRGTFQARFAIDAANVKQPRAKYPIILNLLRGGQNDCDSYGDATNALIASTNIIVWSHTNKWLVAQMDCDRTASWGLGNSNFFDAFNSVLLSPGYPADYVIDIRGFLTNGWGPTAYTNTYIYGDVSLPAGGVHEAIGGAGEEGTNALPLVLNNTTLPLFPQSIYPLLYNTITNDGGGLGNAGHVTFAGGLAMNCVVTGGTNAQASWPTSASTPGGYALVNSNATVFLLTTAPASTAWAATNKLGGP